MRRLSRAVEYRDEETGGHTERMSAYSALLAGKLGLDVESIRIASPMHDVGKVALPDHLLLRPGALDPRRARARWSATPGSGTRSCPAPAARCSSWARRSRSPTTRSGTAPAIRASSSGSAIPLEGQVAAVADVFDALTSDRPYRKAFPLEQAVEIMRDERGQHFDPRLVDLFFENVDQLLELRDRHTPPLVTPEPPAVVA